MDLQTFLCRRRLAHPIMNAAGTCKTLSDVRRFATSAVSALVVGSITWHPREINAGDVYHRDRFFSLNALGLPDPGSEYYRHQLPTMVAMAHDAGKPLILSVAGFAPGEYGALAEIAFERGVDLVEFNLGCPNVYQDGRQHRIASFDRDVIRAILEKAVECVGEDMLSSIGAKLSPYSNPFELVETAAVFQGRELGYVAMCNTFPNALVFDDRGNPVIGTGLAGLSGLVMKPIALGQMYQFAAHLPVSTQLIGAGGVVAGQDVLDYQRAGATAVQASTACWNKGEDPGVYSDILRSYTDLMAGPE